MTSEESLAPDDYFGRGRAIADNCGSGCPSTITVYFELVRVHRPSV